MLKQATEIYDLRCRLHTSGLNLFITVYEIP